MKKFHGIIAQKLSCADQKVWKMEAKWKAFNQCKHFGGGVIYVHFYKWDRSLDFVLFVYDLIELIIEPLF